MEKKIEELLKLPNKIDQIQHSISQLPSQKTFQTLSNPTKIE
jgi:hypothetical protein